VSADGFVGYDELIGELKRLNADRRSGVLFLATGDNESGQLALRDGLIVAIRFRRKTGLEAAYDLRKVRTVRFTFTRDLPDTPDPLHPVSSSTVWAALTDATEPSPAVAEAGVVRNILITALTEYLGPMAAVVVRDQLRDAERTGRDAAEVVEALAKGIDDPAGAIAFRENVTAALVARRLVAAAHPCR
jgi:hypothetical protein